MASLPLIFISAVSRELRSGRQLAANTLSFLGYQPIWQDIFGTETGDLRGMLRQQIDQCKGVLQIVGNCYGAEPPEPDPQPPMPDPPPGPLDEDPQPPSDPGEPYPVPDPGVPYPVPDPQAV